MSDEMLMAARLNTPYVQSPVDDLYSFYYVAQWAAANNNIEFADPDSTPVPDHLEDLRTRLAGSPAERAEGTKRITAIRTMDPNTYGNFLVECRPLLRIWNQKLEQFVNDWEDEIKHLKPPPKEQYNIYYPLFRQYTDRGVRELLELVETQFPGSLRQA